MEPPIMKPAKVSSEEFVEMNQDPMAEWWMGGANRT
jgi:hypothetical protein